MTKLLPRIPRSDDDVPVCRSDHARRGHLFCALMIGARDVPFPRANAFGYYVYLFSGIILWGSLFLVRAGWRLVRVRTTFRIALYADLWDGYLSTIDQRDGSCSSDRRYRTHYPYFQIPYPGHEFQRIAAGVRVGNPCNIYHGRDCDADASDRDKPTRLRPNSPTPTSSTQTWEESAIMATSILVLWASRGVYHLHPCAGNGQ